MHPYSDYWRNHNKPQDSKTLAWLAGIVVALLAVAVLAGLMN
jgi:hypothetical protein